jgi:hypothetical protein
MPEMLLINATETEFYCEPIQSCKPGCPGFWAAKIRFLPFPPASYKAMGVSFVKKY